MKKIKSLLRVVLLWITVIPLTVWSQDTTKPVAPVIKNIAWYTPNHADKINGMAIGLQATNMKKDSLIINGANISAGAITLFTIPYFIMDQFSKNKVIDHISDTAETTINGISISFGGEMAVKVNGINIAGACTGAAILNGVSATGLFSYCHSFRGLNISGLVNKAQKGIGLQIGLFNYCHNLKGLQLGLWNKSGKRGLPFFNWGI